MAENIHKDHKKRLRERFLKDGKLENLYDYEILEMLLSYAIVRKNTNGIAHKLIDRFKTLEGVFEADPNQLMEIEGVGEKAVALLKMQYELLRLYNLEKYKIKNSKYESKAAASYFKAILYGKKDEHLYLMCIDSSDCIIGVKLMGSSEIGRVQMDFREIVKEALAVNASGVILAHNHPNGILRASEDDIVATKALNEFLGHVSIKLIDHLVVTNDGYISAMNYQQR